MNLNKNPITATPYIIFNLYDDLIFMKRIALMRGDMFGKFNKDDGNKIMRMILHFYLDDNDFQKVKMFNHESYNFNVEGFIKETLEKHY